MHLFFVDVERDFEEDTHGAVQAVAAAAHQQHHHRVEERRPLVGPVPVGHRRDGVRHAQSDLAVGVVESCKKKTNQWPRPHPIVSHEEKRRPYLGAGGRGWRPWRPASFRAAGTCPRASTSGGRRTVSVARPPAGARAADGARPTRSRPGTRRTLRRQQQENKNAVKMVALHTDWLHLKGGRACVHSERVRKISFFSLP